MPKYDDEEAGDIYSEESTEALEENDSIDEAEEAFMQGYLNEEEILECAECGLSLDEITKPIRKELNDEEVLFCSKSCLQDYEESL